jgi:putative transposase
MSRKRFVEDPIIQALKKHQARVSTQDLCRDLSVSLSTFYKWKAKYGGMELSEAKRLRDLEEENRKLKRIVADQAIDNIAMKELLSKNS